MTLSIAKVSNPEAAHMRQLLQAYHMFDSCSDNSSKRCTTQLLAAGENRATIKGTIIQKDQEKDRVLWMLNLASS
jgi:hypothetical protein